MAYAGRTGRNSTIRSAIAILLLAVAIVSICIFVAFNPVILESLAHIALIVVAVIVATAAIIYIAAAVLALPYYAAKGEEYQTDSSYDLDDVKSVKEKDSQNKDD
ncbi:MAG: hypothetical protein FWC29_04835 [Methanomassiliicoccaceae archaeon]|nr:hypothetical protein [Methanomassiliicoccaceae archaeon]